MHLTDHLTKESPTLSFEFFPPRTEVAQKTLQTTLRKIKPLSPDFTSVTYGAGGSTRDLTSALVTQLQREKHQPIPHLTCVGHTEKEIWSILETYAAQGIQNILAMRGDLPKGQSHPGGDFTHAADLVRLIKRFNEEGNHPDPRGFGIGVACFPEGHPDTPNRLVEMDHLKAKIDAGADYLCTQAFFDNRDFHDFRERCQLRGIFQPIITGILPLTTPEGMKRMAQLAGKMRYPAKLLRRLSNQSGNAFRATALEHTIAQCRDLIAHEVDGIHFYTLNQYQAVCEIYQKCDFQPSHQLNNAVC